MNFAKDVLQRAGLYPLARGVYRKVAPNLRRQVSLRRDFFGQLVEPGDLCFDVGANLGLTIESLRACGTRVVAVEPNPAYHSMLRQDYGADPHVVVVNKAIGAEPGVARLQRVGASSAASRLEGWWDDHDVAVEAEVMTLAQLMDAHGTPKLLNVGAGGFEVSVFRGLDRPVPTITFEMNGEEPESVAAILDRLTTLGRVRRVNAVSHDDGRWLLERWATASEFLDVLHPLPRTANVVVRMG